MTAVATDEPDDAGKGMVVKIPVSFTTPLQGTNSPPGTTVKARIDGTLSLGSKVVAPQGSLLVGHLEVSDCIYKKESLMRVTFNYIETPLGKRLPVKGTLRPQLGTFSCNGGMKHAHIDDHGCLIELMPLFMTDKERFERYEALSNLVDRAAMSALSSSFRSGGPRGGLPAGFIGGPPANFSGKGTLPLGAASGIFPKRAGFAPPPGLGGGLNYQLLMQWFPTILSAGKELVPLYLNRPGDSVSRWSGGGFGPPGGGAFGPPGGGAFGPSGSGAFGPPGGGLLPGRLPLLGMRLEGMSPGALPAPGVGLLMPLLPAMIPLVRPVAGAVVHPVRKGSGMQPHPHGLPIGAQGAFPVQLHARTFGLPPEARPDVERFDPSVDKNEIPEDMASSPPSAPAFSSRPNLARALHLRRKFSIDIDDELEVTLCLLSEDPLPDSLPLTGPVENSKDGAVEIEVELLDHRSSENCYVGQTVKAKLIKDAVIGDCKVPGGALLYGRISGFRRARRMGSSIVDRKSRVRNGSLAMHFSRIVTADDTLAIAGACPEQRTLFNNSGKFKVVQVNSLGEIHGIQDINAQSDPISSSALTLAKSGLQQSLGGVASFGVFPLVMGAASVIDPRLVATKPIEDDRRPRGNALC